MKIAVILAWVLLLVGQGNAAAESAPQNTPTPRSFKFEKVRRNVYNLPRRPQIRRRAETGLQRLDNLDFLYYANVSLGTPAQSLRLHLDTGSSDIWVESATSDLCLQSDNPCASTGTFDRKRSSTYKRLSSDFQISYIDGEYANGDYGTDIFHLGDGQAVQDLRFGIGIESTSLEGIMGIGMAANEVQVQRLGKKPYKNLVELMVEQKLISTKAYSLWLNSLESSTGEVLFGGIDTDKYEGTLTTLPINKQGEVEPREFIVTLTGISLTNRDGESLRLTDPNFAIPVLLDTGSTYTYLPGPLARALAKQVGALLTERSSVPIVPCNIRNYNGSVNFEFSGQCIRTTLSQLAVNAFTNDGSPATFSDGAALCYFGIVDSGDDTYVLGDTFLRSAYVVYDLENKEISLAQTKYNVSSSNVVEISRVKETDAENTSSRTTTLNPTATTIGELSKIGPPGQTPIGNKSLGANVVSGVPSVHYDRTIFGYAILLVVAHRSLF